MKMSKFDFGLLALIVVIIFNFSSAFSNPFLVSNINPVGDSNPYGFTVFNSKLYFGANDGVNGVELWMYDGFNSPSMVMDINPDPYTAYPSGCSVPYDFIVFNDKLYFRGIAYDGNVGGLWAYDGENQPELVFEPNGFPLALTVFNSKLYFLTSDRELWQYDGVNLPSKVGINGEINLHYLTVFNSKLYFSAFDETHGNEMWEYDGVNPPTMLLDLNPGIGATFQSHFVVFNSKLYFRGDSSELWVYDGNIPPVKVADITYSPHIAEDRYFSIFNNKLYFPAINGKGEELWVYDGINPPAMVVDINPNRYTYDRGGACLSGCSRPHDFTIYNSNLYFRADDGSNGTEFWNYDGINPPVMVADINRKGSSFPGHLTIFKSKIYFRANDGISGTELWAYKPPLSPKPPQIKRSVPPLFFLLLKDKHF